jgi:tetratricopeptide (TPR) repeat protein
MRTHDRLPTSFLFGWLPVVAMVTLSCAPSRGERAREVARTVKAEQTAEKLVARGRMFMEVGDHTRASQYFTAALDAGAAPDQVIPLLMRVYIISSRFRLAIELGEQQLVKKPEAHALRFLVGTLYAAIEQPDMAREHLERVVTAEPKNAEAQYALAVVLRDGQADPVGADEHFRVYLKLEPNGKHADEAKGSLLEVVPP